MSVVSLPDLKKSREVAKEKAHALHERALVLSGDCIYLKEYIQANNLDKALEDIFYHQTVRENNVPTDE